MGFLCVFLSFPLSQADGNLSSFLSEVKVFRSEEVLRGSSHRDAEYLLASDEKTECLATAVCLYGVFGCEGESRHIYIDISLLLFFLQLPHMSNSPAG